MNDLSSDIGLLKRQVRDVQSVAGNIQHLLRKLDHPHAMPRPGGITARHAVCAVRGFIEKRGPENVARQLFANDRALSQLIERAASGPAMTAQPGWASEIVGDAVADLLTNVMPASVLSQLRAASGAEFLFVDGGIVRAPQHTPTPTGSFVAEANVIPVAQLLLSSVNLPPRKCAAIVAFSKELASGSAVNVEIGFRTLLQQDLALAVDAILLDANAGNTTRPPGLLTGLSGLTPSASGTPAEKIAADIRTLFVAIAPALMPTLIVSTVESAVLDVAAPALSKIASVSVPVGTVIAIDASAFISALGPADFLASENPLVHMDTAAQPISATGSPNTVSAPTMSMFQQGAIGLRCLVPANWALRRANATSYMTGVTW